MTETLLADRALSLADLEARVGTELGISGWHNVTQGLIDQFAEVTGDDQYIHVDPVRAAVTPFGGTIAHGFLTLSLISLMGREALPPVSGRTMSINYGFDNVRFLSPVRSSAAVRGHFTLAKVERRAPTQLMLHWQVSVEIKDEPKPALVAEWLVMAVLG
jgi:acyl dehydratase